MDDNLLLMYMYMALMEEEAKRGGGSQAAQAQSDLEKAKETTKKGKDVYDFYKDVKTALLGSGVDTTALNSLNAQTQAAWNAPGLAASGVAPLGAATATGLASLATVPTVVGGVATIPAGAAIPAGWAGVGSAVGGGTMVAPAAAAGASGAGGAGASGASSAGMASWAGPAAIAVAAALTAKASHDNYKAAKKAADGGNMTDAEVATIYSPWRGAAMKYLPQEVVKPMAWMHDNFAPSAHIARAVWGTKKHEDQVYRDRVRGRLKKGGIIDDQYNLTLDGGLKFDIGKDGKSRAYQIDQNNPNWQQAAGLANPLSEILVGSNGKDKKLMVDFAGYFGNAAMSGGDMKKNLRAVYDKAGLTQRQAYDILESRGLDQDTLRAYQNAVNETFGNGGFDARGNIQARPNAAGTTSTPPPANGTQQTFPKSPTMIPRTGKAPPGYRPGPRR